MSTLVEVVERPDLVEPVLVVALEGWIDAGLGGVTAAATLTEALSPTLVASFDADRLLDHRSRRPVLHLRDGENTGLTWPTIELRAGRDRQGADVLLLLGAEPDHEWRAFADAVVDLVLDLGVRLVLSLGAYPAPIPHTRPSQVVATATTAELAAEIGYVPGALDLPGGVAAVLERRAAEVGIPACGLWAQVPHYAAALPYPPAALALLEKLAAVAGLDLPTGSLAEDAPAARSRLDALVAASPEHVEMVRQLEAQVDGGQGGVVLRGDLPSGDELAAELERYLRDEDDGA